LICRQRLLAALVWLAFTISAQAASGPVAYSRRTAAAVSLHVIDVDLTDPRVVIAPAIAARGIGRSERFESFVARLRPTAAVNGTYFGRRSLRPVGDIVAGGKLLHFGGMGTAVAFGDDGVDVIRLPKSRRVDWSEHRAAIAGGPLLVWDGFPKPMPGGEGFGDPRVFARAAPRTAVGVTRDNHLLLVTTVGGTSLGKLAKAMRELGAVYALNLDGGSSVGMYYQGRMIRRAKGSLTNVLGVYVKSEPVREGDLRPPEGLDWRAGHRQRPVLTLSTKEVRVATLLPRKWEQRSSLHLRSNAPLPEGWNVRVLVDQKTAAAAGALPAEITLDLANLAENVDHEIRIRLVDAHGKTIAHVERIFRMGQPA